MKLAESTLSPAALRRLAPWLLLAAAVLLIFHDTAAQMVGIWIRSETFAHAFLVPLIVVWLVWRRRAELARLQPRPAPWLLLPIAAVCVMWLMGTLVGVNTAPQLALVTLVVLSVPALFGLEVARAITFPLLFLFFAVPMGEFLVPGLVQWTADFTVQALQASGVPVYREGNQFVIPTGSWSVVEACSGIRYLIASFMVGTLFAYLNYHSPRRRAVFMLVSLLVPLIANWLRAYMIVMLGHLSGNRLAAGVDHIIYGWVFFGLVIGVMFMIGARWAQADLPLAPEVAAPAARASSAAAQRGVWIVGMGMVGLMLTIQIAFARLDHDHEVSAPPLSLPDTWAGATAVSADGKSLSSWQPGYDNPRTVARRDYRAGEDDFGVWVGYYRDQGYEHKLVSSTHDMVATSKENPWSQTSWGLRILPMAPAPVAVRTGDLRGSASPDAPLAQRLRVWQVYWVGGRFMTDDVHVRLQLAWNRLLGRGDDSAVIFVFTPLPTTPDKAATELADRKLERFTAGALPQLAQLLAHASRAP